jgi:hypothetical protein
MKYTLMLWLITGSISLFSQNIQKEQLDSLYNNFIKFKNARLSETSEIKQEPVKCGVTLIYSVRNHFNEFDYDRQNILKPLLTRPDLQASIVSPSGFFRIHYDTTGTNVPIYYTAEDLLHYSKQQLLQMYIDSTALAADSAYNFEVNFLGFPPPPSDSGAGGDNKYDIYLENLAGFYGDTQFDGNFGPSYMEVNSNFTSSFPTRGIYAVRVTIAHEFHHGIQVGNYIYRDSDAWFH